MKKFEGFQICAYFSLASVVVELLMSAHITFYFFFCKTSNLHKDVKRTEPSLSVRVPCPFSKGSLSTIEIGLEQAPFVVFVNFFPHLNMQKKLLIMDTNNTKNSSKSVIFSYLTLNNIVRILLLL